ncbi:hypothetical protein GTO91_09115 [Heliobacterium undosum]|uniref:Uncharacterized protein n=1 Tax=Heliomicrobium undosum TaxID=121734 RepID=A0A845L0Y7_9FIRM|nr:hypothetical protein [Heliomicrobium undosum]MZP29863.1 hypothetical protein [Heliomicrobium undosum]
MVDFSTDVGDIVYPDDIHRLDRYVNQLRDGDELVISVDANDAHQTDSILTFLRKNGMKFHTEGSHDGKEYYIVARRKLH